MDPASRAYFFRIFLGCLGCFIILGVVLYFAREFEAGFLKNWIVLSFFASAALSSLVYAGLHLLGRGVGGLFHAGRKTPGPAAERLAADLDRARYMKMQKRHGDALKVVEEVLHEEPDLPEALLLKAQILWEGYKNAGQARMCLRKIMQAPGAVDEPVQRWAQSLYEEILSGGRKPTNIWEP